MGIAGCALLMPTAAIGRCWEIVSGKSAIIQVYIVLSYLCRMHKPWVMMDGADLERLQKDSVAMIQFLKRQEQELNEIRIQNEILAREALLHGFDPDVVAPPSSKKGRKAGPKSKPEITDN